MRVLNRYILTSLVRSFLIIVVAISSILWLVQISGYVQRFLNSALPAGDMLYLLSLIFPQALSLCLPVAWLAAVLHTYQRFNDDFELTVMWAAGVSKWHAARPAAVVACLVTLTLFGLTHFVAPWSSRAFWQAQNEVIRDAAMGFIEPGTFHRILDGVTVFVRERDRDGTFLGLLIHDTRDPARQITLNAKRGVVVGGAEGWRFVVYEGNMQWMAENKSLQVIEFDKYTIELSRARPRPNRIRRPYERYLDELLYPEADAFLGNRPEELTVEIHVRLTYPLIILVLTVIALAPFLGPPSGDRVRYPRVAAAFIAGLGVVVANNWAMALALDDLSFIPLIYLALALPAGLALGYVLLNPSRLRDLRQWRAGALSRNRTAPES